MAYKEVQIKATAEVASEIFNSINDCNYVQAVTADHAAAIAINCVNIVLGIFRPLLEPVTLEEWIAVRNGEDGV